MSPQGSRQLPAGEPLFSPTGTSPQGSALLGPEDGASSLAGSTWGASTVAGPAGRANGTAELADTLTSRLRPLITTAGGTSVGRHQFQSQLRRLGGPGEGLVGLPAQPGCAAVAPHQEGSNLVFLSARPESYKVCASWDGRREAVFRS
jgi:hypothetical protein